LAFSLIPFIACHKERAAEQSVRDSGYEVRFSVTRRSECVSAVAIVEELDGPEPGKKSAFKYLKINPGPNKPAKET
jgi:hypothetical protein